MDKQTLCIWATIANKDSDKECDNAFCRKRNCNGVFEDKRIARYICDRFLAVESIIKNTKAAK